MASDISRTVDAMQLLKGIRREVGFEPASVMALCARWPRLSLFHIVNLLLFYSPSHQRRLIFGP